MQIKKEVLVSDVPGLYAVGEVMLDGVRYYAAASEDHNGKVMLVHSETKEVTMLSGGLGGCMAVLPAPEKNCLLYIEEFYPVFDSATAKVIRVQLKKTGESYEVESRTVVAEVPYVHRISVIKEEDGYYLACGRLCKHKDNPDDWSTSGTMEIYKYVLNGTAADPELVQDGIYKHHAMFVKKNAEGFDDLYYGGTAGAFKTIRKDGKWITTQLLDVPVSDIVVQDLDEDGVDEISIIEEFHGDQAVVFKKKADGYERCLEIPMKFGHVLWGGTVLGRPALICGSRAGDKKLAIYRFKQTVDGMLGISEEVITDDGQAPAQLHVDDFDTSSCLLAANHGAHELVRYTVLKNS